GDNRVRSLDIGHQADGFAMTAPARKLSCLEGEEPTRRRENHDSIGRLRPHDKFALIAFLVSKRRDIFEVTLQGPDPALLGADDGNRLAFESCLLKFHIEFGSFGKIGATATDFGLLAEFFFQVADFARDLLPLLAGRSQQLVEPSLLSVQSVAFSADFEFLKLAQ